MNGVNFASGESMIELGNPAGISATGEHYVSHVLIKHTGNHGGSTNAAIKVFDTNNINAKFYIYNNVIRWVQGTDSIGIYMREGNTYAYNNTIDNVTFGFYTNTGALAFVKNNIVQGSSANAYSGDVSYDASSGYNLGDDASPVLANDVPNATVTFVDVANGDYRLSLIDTVAKGAGTNLAGDVNLAFSDDVANAPRTPPVVVSNGKSVKHCVPVSQTSCSRTVHS